MKDNHHKENEKCNSDNLQNARSYTLKILNASKTLVWLLMTEGTFPGTGKRFAKQRERWVLFIETGRTLKYFKR